MISIVIPLYNKRNLIKQTLDSVFAQTFQDFEIIIVDDGSTDGSAEVVAQIPDSRIKLIRQANAGVSAARNKGISEAHGDYIALLDADDEWKPEYLKKMIELTHKYPDCDIYASNYEFKDSKGHVTNTILNNLPFNGEDGVLSNYFEVASTSHPPICSISIMAKKDCFLSIGGFPEGIKSGEDLITWARLACKYKIAYCIEPLATFIFDEKIFNEDQKRRTVSISDEVGHGLRELYMKFNPTNIKDYIALWYKMRARIYLSKRHRIYAFKECTKSLKYNFDPKIIVFMIMCALPFVLNDKLFKRFG